MSLFYRKIEGGTQPLLILHGVFGSSDNWLTAGKQIAAAGYTVYLIDQRNHGRSPHYDKLDYPSMAEDLHDLLLEEKIDNPILVGHSMGGKTVMEYVSRYPDSASRLIVVDIAPKAYKPHHGRLLEGLTAIPIDRLQSRKEADNILSGYERSLAVRQFLLKNLYTKEDGSFGWRLNLPVVKRDMPLVGHSVTSDSPLTLPTLFIRGEKSDYIQDSDVDGIRKMFPNSEVVTIPGSGHWIQAEQPALFLKAVVDFLHSTKPN